MILGLPIYFLLMDFFLFSMAGWIYESTFVSVRSRKLVNRGFLVGPILPLYGFGAVSVYLLLRPFADIPSLLYVIGMVVATVLEYITSIILEKFFHTRWWDYSKEPYNFQGRVALIPSMFWGILSLLMFDVLQPAATFMIHAIPAYIGHLFLRVAIGIFLVDLIYSVVVAVNFRKQLENLYEFKKELEYLLEDIRFSSLWEVLSVSTRVKSGRSILAAYNEKKELFYSKLSTLRSEFGEKDSGLAVLEERLKSFWEKRTHFLKVHPFSGNRRLIDAFPSMKLTSKNHSAVDVKELLMQMKQKTEKIQLSPKRFKTSKYFKISKRLRVKRKEENGLDERK